MCVHVCVSVCYVCVCMGARTRVLCMCVYVRMRTYLYVVCAFLCVGIGRRCRRLRAYLNDYEVNGAAKQ